MTRQLPLQPAENRAGRTTFTVDVEDHRPEDGPAGGCSPRYEGMTRRLLDFLEAHGVAGTFFIDGELARRSPSLVREIAARRHEIGSHSYRHVTLECETPAGFAAGIAAAKARLEDLSGAAVLGFRAPAFSVTPPTCWAIDVLGHAGFAYSSSVVPGPALVGGYPGAPRRPFLWPNGLLEIPCPVGTIGRWAVPFRGGMYLRYLPPWRYRRLQAQLGEQADWTYCHPYDIDGKESFARLPGRGWIVSLLLRANRGITLRRWHRLAAHPAPPFAARLPELRAAAVLFEGQGSAPDPEA
ncbi:MAG: polysaccharide deacetylase family protein [Acidisphaera sp.]|nr:polysaccharide deacetylase family protein [Acidisphaera sp.]